MCGNCDIDSFGGLCPISRCPKNMLNGPCGGSIDGKCEIDNDMPCIWHIIYKVLKNKDQLYRIRKIKYPKDWSRSTEWKREI
jgi:hypothetical protein